MKAMYFVQPAEDKKKGLFDYFKKNKVRTIHLVQYGNKYFAFGEDADILSKYFRTTSWNRIESRNAGVQAKKLHWVISCLTGMGYRLAIVARVPD